MKQYHLHKIEHRIRLFGLNRPKNRRLYEITIPKVLSLFDAPNETMKFLFQLKKFLSSDEIALDLYIDHSRSEKITIDASFLFDKIIEDYRKYWKQKRITVHLTGRSSKVREVNNFLLSFGFFSTINIIVKQICPSDADDDYKKHFIIFRKSGSSKVPYLAGNACTELTDFFDKCFNDNGFSIKKEAKGNLVDAFGEIIKNAEEHSGIKDSLWNVIGCYSRKDHICSFSIINDGQSFFDSLSSHYSMASKALSEIDDLVLKHMGFLKKAFTNKSIYAQNIWTMMSLQDGISSKRTESGKASSRGQGMMDIISFIDAVRNKKRNDSYISIISGNTNILIDFSFPIIKKKIRNSNDIRRMMIFNKEQNLHMPPNSKYVNNIDDKYKGVIISGLFTIDTEYLQEVIGRE